MNIPTPAPRLIRSGFLLPNPMVGETVRSVWARFHRATPFAPVAETRAEMLGPKAQRLFGHHLPAHLPQIATQVGAGHAFGDTRYTMEQHTMLPYFCYFHTSEQREQTYAAMLRRRGMVATSAMIIKNTSHYGLGLREWPSFCPLCTYADLQVHGFSYWRIAHQLPAVVVCPWHHCALREVRGGGKDLKGNEIQWPPMVGGPSFDEYPRVEHPPLDKAHLVRLSQASLYVQERPAGFPGDWRVSMMAVLREMGFRSRGGFAHEEIAQRVTAVHGQALLEWLRLTAPGAVFSGRLLRRMLGSQRARRATILYLVLALAIRPDLATLEKEMAEQLADRERHRNIFWPAWIDALGQQWDAGDSVKVLALRYRCSQTMVRRYLVRLGKTLGPRREPLDPQQSAAFFAAAREGKTTTELRKQFKIATKAVPILLEQDAGARQLVERADFWRSRDIFRARALRTMAANPGITAQELAYKFSNVYQLLRRYDAQWCEENLPKPTSLVPPVANGRSVTEIDRDLSARVARMIRFLVKDEGMTQVAVPDVISRCRAAALYSHYRGQLPLTDAALARIPATIASSTSVQNGA